MTHALLPAREIHRKILGQHWHLCTQPASDPKEPTPQCPPSLTKDTQEETILSTGTLQAKDPKQSDIIYTKVNRAVIEIAKEYQTSTEYERYASGNHSRSRTYAKMLAEFFTPQYLKYRMLSPAGWPLSVD
jgi:hypothetical protein